MSVSVRSLLSKVGRLDNCTDRAYVSCVIVSDANSRFFWRARAGAEGCYIMLNTALRNWAWVLCTKQLEPRYIR